MTILEALSWGETKLKETAQEKQTQTHNAKLDAQALLSFVLKKPTSYLFAHVDETLPRDLFDQYARVVRRRQRHEPIAYIFGRKSFFGRSFYVNPSVLIPRPETELIIELIQKSTTEHTMLIDVGTGSGAIAVTAAAELNLPTIAIDASQRALAVATHNANQHGVAGRMSFLCGNLLEPYFKTQTRALEQRVVITANLPYIPTREWQKLDPDVNTYEPQMALVAGVDGLDLYDELLQQIKQHRSTFPSSLELYMEIDPSQAQILPSLVQTHFPQAQTHCVNDLSAKPRVVIAHL